MSIDLDKVLKEHGVVKEAEAIAPEAQDQPVDPVETDDDPVETDDDPVVNNDPQKVEDPIDPASPVVDEFPSDKFKGKFKSWDEVTEQLSEFEKLKSAEPESPFKDDFIKKVVDIYNEKGNLSDFFKAHSVDWKEMPSEDVLKESFKEKNKKLDKKFVDKLWEKEKSKYSLDSEDDEEAELGRALMERDADEVRNQRIKDQEGYLQVEPKEAPPKYTPDQIKEAVKKLPEVEMLLKNKNITHKIGDSDFNLEVTDPGFIVEALANDRVLIDKFIKKDGNHDVQGFIDVVNYASNPEAMRQAYVDYGRTLGKTEVIDGDYKNSTLKGKTSTETNAKVPFSKGLAMAFAEKYNK